MASIIFVKILFFLNLISLELAVISYSIKSLIFLKKCSLSKFSLKNLNKDY